MGPVSQLISRPIAEILKIPGVLGTVDHQVPKNYQVEDCLYLLQFPHTNDFSEAGTRKTLKALMYLMVKLAEGKKVIVAMPPTLVRQFSGEFIRLIKKHPYTTYTLKSSKQLEGVKTKELVRQANIIFLSIQMFSKSYRQLLARTEKNETALIVDECHSLKNPETSYWHAVNEAIHTYGCSYLGMGATPTTVELLDAYGHISLKSPEKYKSFEQFQRRHVKYRTITISRWKSYQIITGYEEEEEIAKALNWRAVRRRVDDVLDMKEPNILQHVVHLSAKHKEMYRTMMKERILNLPDDEVQVADNESAMRAYAMQLITVPEKYIEGLNLEDTPLVCLFRILDRLLPGKKVVVFCQYRATVKKLVDQISKRYKLKVATLFGGKNEANLFQCDPACKVIVCNYDSGYSGHNFQVAYNIIMYEANGSPAVINQAIARCRRGDQEHVVSLWLFRYKGTLASKLVDSCLGRDDRIVRMMGDKRSLLSLLRNES